jgi:hypothetical protein
MVTQNSERPGRRCAAALVALIALGAPLLGQAAAQAQLDRSTTTPGQPLTLSITSDTAASGTQPDLTPLQADFQVLGTSSGSETRIDNGHRSDQQRWIIRLQPKHVGRIAIAPIVVGADRTAALEVNVADVPPAQRAADGQHAFLEVDANPANRSPYVQQQLPYTIRLFYDDSVTPMQLDAPAAGNAVVEQLGPDKHYTATRQGHAYNVIERNYAIAPEKSGTLVIPPPEFQGTESVAGDASRDVDPQNDILSRLLGNPAFANMPGMRGLARGSPFAQETRPIGAAGQQVTLDVKPRPAGIQGNWLPAEQLELKDGWAGGAPAFKVGEPVTRVITIQAKGLAASQIPSLAVATLENAHVYPEAPDNQSQTDGQSIYGISKQSVTYIPTRAGAMEVPAIDLAWWDVRSNVQRHATLPAFSLQVAPGAAGAQAGPSPPATSVVASDIPQGVGAAARQSSLVGESWKLIAGLTVLGALAVLLAYWLRRRQRESRGIAGRANALDSPPRRATTMRALHTACALHDKDKAAQALRDLARLKWPENPPRGLAALAARVEGGGREVLDLDRCLYGGGEARWDGSALWKAIGAGLLAAPISRTPQPTGLEPLYH